MDNNCRREKGQAGPFAVEIKTVAVTGAYPCLESCPQWLSRFWLRFNTRAQRHQPLLDSLDFTCDLESSPHQIFSAEDIEETVGIARASLVEIA